MQLQHAMQSTKHHPGVIAATEWASATARIYSR
jgi:hypothetical protein